MRLKLLWIVFLILAACSDDMAGKGVNNVNNANNANNVASNNGATDVGLDGGSTGTNSANNVLPDGGLPDLPFEVNDAGQVLCGDAPCQCADGIDNDGDGQTDGFDIECTGPFDDDEDSFATGIPGDNRDPVWQDCFFDGNSGSGDDGCRYKTGCMTGELPQSDPDCQLSARCIQFCAKYAPNGCDCFGCCEVYPTDQNSPIFIKIGNSCSDDKFDDPVSCPQCVPSTQCGNECGVCELCGGKTVDELPTSCFTSGADMGNPSDMGTGDPGYACDDGAQVCSATERCSADEYCAQGCCIKILL